MNRKWMYQSFFIHWFWIFERSKLIHSKAHFWTNTQINDEGHVRLLWSWARAAILGRRICFKPSVVLWNITLTLLLVATVFVFAWYDHNPRSENMKNYQLVRAEKYHGQQVLPPAVQKRELFYLLHQTETSFAEYSMNTSKARLHTWPDLMSSSQVGAPTSFFGGRIARTPCLQIPRGALLQS